jgi:hypothetical protein
VETCRVVDRETVMYDKILRKRRFDLFEPAYLRKLARNSPFHYNASGWQAIEETVKPPKGK